MFQELAFQIAKKAHSKQVDKAGKDYMLIAKLFEYES